MCVVRPSVRLPWEQQFGVPPPIPHVPGTNEFMKEAPKKRTRSPTLEKTANVPGSTRTKQPFAPTTDVEDAEQRGLAEHRWASILNYALETCSLCRQVAGEPLTHRRRSIEDALGSKSTGTLLKRSRAILCF